ncbi:MAG: tRNA guanosine(34) transglycosylase Tgt [Acidimicrobiia bacterium]|nr:tRNA guanosine(34) transglycosylase Tgt [Acidimicrobiia bacterium]
MPPVTWSAQAEDVRARSGILTTPHGTVQTPAFMPVGTRASVRALDSADLRTVGAEMVLANTYHLMLRPGSELIDRLGGLHAFMAWDGPILTDSGGYQIFSLEPTVTEEGATFRSTYDGSIHLLTPEGATRVQELLGPDIAMVLDVLIGLPAPRAEVRSAMERTHRWAERAAAAHTRPDQAQFGIIQGGTDPELRAESARVIASIGFAGFGIGGLAVGETMDDRNIALDAVVPELPSRKARYVMGLGDPEGVLSAVARGADLFDCVWPTRLARHGRAITWSGDFNIRRLEFADDERGLDDRCGCATCTTYSRAYLRHLQVTGELSLHRLLSIHNLTMTQDLLAGARAAIAEQRFEAYRREVITARSTPGRA